MDTLPNDVDPRPEEKRPAEGEPFAKSLSASSILTGVSERNAHELQRVGEGVSEPQCVEGNSEQQSGEEAPALRWYVLRTSYGRAAKAEAYIRAEGTETFLPMHSVLRLRHGQRRLLRVPLLPSILFIRADARTADRYVRQTPRLPYVSYYYNHFTVNAYGINPPLVVADAEMRNFIRATSVDSQHIKLAHPDLISLKAGDKVRVVEGPFAGVEGRVVRYAGQQRVAVTLTGFITLLTAYVPTGFLEAVNSEP